MITMYKWPNSWLAKLHINDTWS